MPTTPTGMLTAAELARATGHSERSVRAVLTAARLLPTRGERNARLYPAEAAMRAIARSPLSAVSKAHARRDRAQAELIEIKEAIATGDLLPIERYFATLTEHHQRFETLLGQLPGAQYAEGLARGDFRPLERLRAQFIAFCREESPWASDNH